MASSTEDLITAQDQSDDTEDDVPLMQLTSCSPRSSCERNSVAFEPSAQLSKPSVALDCGANLNDDSLLTKCSKSDDQGCSHEENDKEETPLPKKINPDDAVEKAEDELKNDSNYCIDDHVLVKWDSLIYPGKIISMSAEGALISCMKKGKFWKWPSIKDEQLYTWESVIKKIGVPKFVKKGLFRVPELDKLFN